MTIDIDINCEYNYEHKYIVKYIYTSVCMYVYITLQL